MNCPQCGATSLPDDARYCPACGTRLAESKEPVARVTVAQDVGKTGQVTGLYVENVEGSVTVERIEQSVTAHIEGEAIARLFERDRTRKWLRDLASQIDASVTGFLMAIQFAEVGAASFSQADFDQSYVDWEIKRETIESVLRSHRLSDDIIARWDAFVTNVSEVYALSGTYAPAIRLPRLERIQAALPDADVDWEGLEDLHARRASGKTWERYMTAWWAMRHAVMVQKDGLVTDILNSPVSAEDSPALRGTNERTGT